MYRSEKQKFRFGQFPLIGAQRRATSAMQNARRSVVIPRRVLCKAVGQAKVARNAESLFQKLRASNAMKHVCDHGAWGAPLEGGAFKMRPRRRRKALASLLGFA